MMANQIMHRMSATLCQSKACRGSVLMLRFGQTEDAIHGSRSRSRRRVLAGLGAEQHSLARI
jgi:hypothetical protein